MFTSSGKLHWKKLPAAILPFVLIPALFAACATKPAPIDTMPGAIQEKPVVSEQAPDTVNEAPLPKAAPAVETPAVETPTETANEAASASEAPVAETPAVETPPEAAAVAETPPVTAPATETPVDDAKTQTILRQVSQLLAEQKYSEAIALFNDLDTEAAQKTPIQLILASIYNSGGMSAKAREITGKILAAEPDNTEALLVLAASAAAEGKDKEQRSTLEQVIKIDPQNVKALCDLGYIALRSQSLSIAAGYFDRALTVDKNSGEALTGRAIVYRYNRDPKKSEQLLNQAIQLYPDWASPLNERARLYRGAGFFADALSDLDAAKKLEPYNYWISVDRGMTLVDLSRKDEALAEFTNAISLDPGNFLAYVYSAGLKDDAGDLDGAESDYTTVTKLKPEYYFAFEGLGIIKMKKQQWTQARDAFLSAYKYAPKDYTYALLAAVNWMRGGTVNDPKQFLAQVLRTAPRDSLEYSMLKLYYDQGGDLDVALRIDKEQNPDSKARMLFYLANYYDIRKNKSLADRYFMSVRDLDRKGIPEWRINDWFIQQRGLAISDN